MHIDEKIKYIKPKAMSYLKSDLTSRIKDNEVEISRQLTREVYIYG